MLATDARNHRLLPAFSPKTCLLTPIERWDAQRQAGGALLATPGEPPATPLQQTRNSFLRSDRVDRDPVLSGKALMSYRIGEAKITMITETILDGFNPAIFFPDLDPDVWKHRKG
jgi:hypothetical protein